MGRRRARDDGTCARGRALTRRGLRPEYATLGWNVVGVPARGAMSAAGELNARGSPSGKRRQHRPRSCASGSCASGRTRTFRPSDQKSAFAGVDRVAGCDVVPAQKRWTVLDVLAGVAPCCAVSRRNPRQQLLVHGVRRRAGAGRSLARDPTCASTPRIIRLSDGTRAGTGFASRFGSASFAWSSWASLPEQSGRAGGPAARRYCSGHRAVEAIGSDHPGEADLVEVEAELDRRPGDVEIDVAFPQAVDHLAGARLRRWRRCR